MATSNATKAGAAIFVGAVQFSILLILSEIIYTAHGPLNTVGSGNTTGYIYSVSSNAVSDLGVNCRSTCTAVPSGYLFDASVVVLGLLVLVGSYYLNRAFHYKPGAAMFALAGVGAVGVGLFPETTGIAHSIFTLIAFLPAGLAGLVAARLAKKPMFYFAMILGVATLAALVLFVGGLDLGLGPGGMERMVIYPALMLAIGFGGHLMGQEDWPKS